VLRLRHPDREADPSRGVDGIHAPVARRRLEHSGLLDPRRRDELAGRLDIVRRVAAHARTLAPVAREHGVRVALENVMPGPATEIATRALADLDPEVFGFCYDSSQDQIDGPRSFALRLRDRLDAPPV
jgi:sugar phosphate isomerase/epimerase